MRIVIGFLLVCVSPLALSQNASLKGNASGLLSGPQGIQDLILESSSAHDRGTTSRLLDIHSQGFDPWVKQVTGAHNRHAGPSVQIVLMRLCPVASENPHFG